VTVSGLKKNELNKKETLLKKIDSISNNDGNGPESSRSSSSKKDGERRTNLNSKSKRIAKVKRGRDLVSDKSRSKSFASSLYNPMVLPSYMAYGSRLESHGLLQSSPEMAGRSSP